MALRRFLVFGGLTIGALHAPVPASGQQGRVSLDGYWTGRTSQGRPIGFRIEAGTMRTLELDWTLKYDVCPAGAGALNQAASAETFFFFPDAPGYEPPRIRFPAFTLTREIGTLKAPVTMELSGSFGSDSTVSGDMALTATGCTGREALTRKAGRKTGRISDDEDGPARVAHVSPRGSS